MKEITINGKTYPCYQTMGALLRFKQETGRDPRTIADDVADMCIFLWCCVASACNRERKPFDLSLLDFADSIGLDDLTSWAAAQASAGEGDGEGEQTAAM